MDNSLPGLFSPRRTEEPGPSYMILEWIRQRVSMVGSLVDGEVPVPGEYAATRFARRFGLQHVGSRMVAIIDEAILEARRSERLYSR
jgi:hypothetical protein